MRCKRCSIPLSVDLASTVWDGKDERYNYQILCEPCVDTLMALEPEVACPLPC